MPDPARHRRAPGHVWRWFRGTALVMGPDLEPLELAGGAASVWRALEQPATVDDLVAHMTAEALAADAPPAPPEAVAHALQDLIARGLVVGAAAP